jgi:two-component system sensor kinase FixL
MNDLHRQLTEQLVAVLQDRMKEGGEGALLRAYELGRSALASQLNVLDMVVIQQDALVQVLLRGLVGGESVHLAHAAAEVFAESLAPFELARRSAQEGAALLQYVNAELQRQVAERTEALRRERDFVERLIETAQDAVIVIDRQGRIELFNPAAERIFGYTRAEVVGQSVRMLMPEPYASEHDSHLARYERTGEARAIGRTRTVTARRKNGEIFPVEISVAEIRGGNEVRYSAFIRDISEKVRLQEQLLERERLAAVGTTVAKLVHEIGNPLNGMFVATQRLQRRLSQYTLDDTITASVRALRDQIAHLSHLLQEFRSLSRRQEFTFQPTDLVMIVRDVLAAELPFYTERQVTVEQEFALGVPVVRADGDKLRQVVCNLCKNAVEAMPAGGTLRVRVHSDGEQVILEVADTGVGIPVGVDIFEPFVTTKAEGTGLGLAIVRQIVEAHRGSLTYTSEPGQGTTFRVGLPLRSAAEPPPPSQSQ